MHCVLANVMMIDQDIVVENKCQQFQIRVGKDSVAIGGTHNCVGDVVRKWLTPQQWRMLAGCTEPSTSHTLCRSINCANPKRCRWNQFAPTGRTRTELRCKPTKVIECCMSCWCQRDPCCWCRLIMMFQDGLKFRENPSSCWYC